MTDDTLQAGFDPCNQEDYTNALSWLLPNGQHTVIDVDTIPLMLAHNWKAYLIGEPRRPVVRRSSSGKPSLVYLHRVIMDCPIGLVVDHRNRRPLDNRRANMRVCTARENSINAPGNVAGTSRYKGVYKHSRLPKWVAHIQNHGVHKHLGVFPSEVEAAHAYNAAAREIHGEFAFLNPV